MKHIYCILFLNISIFCFAQKKEKLQVGERIPFSRVELLNQEKKVTSIDLPNGKNLTDRFVLVYFYSANTSVKQLIAFNNDVERVLNKFQNNACKGASEIEYVTICIDKDFTKWQTLLSETNYNKQKFTGKKTNYLTRDGTKDKVVTVFKTNESQNLFLVNPKGRLYIETDSVAILERTFQNICRLNSTSSTADITGKILIGEKNKIPLTQHNVYLIKSNIDTLKTTATDAFGDFTFTQVDTTQSLSVAVQQTTKLDSKTKMYLAKQTGEIVSEFKKNKLGGFEYKLLVVDKVKLTLIEDDDDITMKYKKFNTTNKKDLTVDENVYYELGQYTLLTESEIVLDKVIIILNAAPTVKLEIISHTDAQGNDDTNFALSQNRSNAVINYLIAKGIDKGRLKGIGKGETEIRNRCGNNVTCSDKEHEYNRRTEFKFIKN